MTTGAMILVLAVLSAAGFAAYRSRVDGRFADPEFHDLRAWDRIAAATSAAHLGERVTFVQFSSAFCAPCRATRVLLADVAASEDGVRHVEVDAEQHLDLVRELGIQRTPTTVVLDADGHEVTRAAGAPQRHQVLAAIPATSGG